MIRYPKERHIWVGTVANGSLLHLNEKPENFLNQTSFEFKFIDGEDKKTLESIRRRTQFVRVLQNVTDLNRLAKSVGKEVMTMLTFVQDRD